MKLTFRELMDRLGVPNELSPYETYPLTAYDDEKGITCSAEIRMGMDGNELEGEIQLMYDTPPATGPSMQQILWFVAKPVMNQPAWETKDARLKNKPVERTLYNWEEKSCNFFGAVARSIKMDQFPNIDELIEEEFHSKERTGRGSSGGGGKSPKIKPGQLLGMKKGQGF
jgi:hypothetical protein